MSANALALLGFRLVTSLIGLAFAAMGYKLFQKGVYEASDIKAVWGNRSMLLRRAAPGVCLRFSVRSSSL